MHARVSSCADEPLAEGARARARSQWLASPSTTLKASPITRVSLAATESNGSDGNGNGIGSQRRVPFPSAGTSSSQQLQWMSLNQSKLRKSICEPIHEEPSTNEDDFPTNIASEHQEYLPGYSNSISLPPSPSHAFFVPAGIYSDLAVVDDLEIYKRHHRPRPKPTRTRSTPSQLISTTTTHPVHINYSILGPAYVVLSSS